MQIGDYISVGQSLMHPHPMKKANELRLWSLVWIELCFTNIANSY